jgi:hypothetical protein
MAAKARKGLNGTLHLSGKPKRTRIGDGWRVRSRVCSGRTKRSNPRKKYRGQGKG